MKIEWKLIRGWMDNGTVVQHRKWFVHAPWQTSKLWNRIKDVLAEWRVHRCYSDDIFKFMTEGAARKIKNERKNVGSVGKHENEVVW